VYEVEVGKKPMAAGKIPQSSIVFKINLDEFAGKLGRDQKSGGRPTFYCNLPEKHLLRLAMIRKTQIQTSFREHVDLNAQELRQS
jgi:hypothetical protein